ncbi:CheR family methyltransferase [Methylobacterium nonmethylotrophicum]|uniref:protein-glutamate O-methyltransferase n=1 Tax=Methylobacterium nonmethylotrophicum TaxID=1141884 RepID=A0A4Z0NHH3_9HYPH|nr:protein-glutamate O-methyltransferase CheR [Methylobacterium nonmethylotrophicum]TGD95133.1 protein-glutamate O-methyltransferase CheR [Methylobacterium nonmethylotrophicum]
MTALLTEPDLAQVCDLLYRQTGIQVPGARRPFIERRVLERMRATGARTFADYLARLRADGDGEVQLFVNAFTVNETYFFREEHQLSCLTASLLREVTAGRRPGETIRIWSMPCATGEEPYSLAIWLLEHWPEVDAWEIEIVGSDIDTRALAAAQAGRYGARALGRLPPALVARYFTPEDGPDGAAAPAGPNWGPRWRILPELRDSVRLSRRNLVDGAGMAQEGRFDVVFCRNVLIYFDDASRKRAAANLYAALRPGGFLCLGHTESMARIPSRFRTRRFPEAIVYQRPPEDAHE